MFYQKNKGQNRNTKTAVYGTSQVAANESNKHKRLRADRIQGTLDIIQSPIWLSAL
jgi:hypothetical protein